MSCYTDHAGSGLSIDHWLLYYMYTLQQYSNSGLPLYVLGICVIVIYTNASNCSIGVGCSLQQQAHCSGDGDGADE